MRSPVFSDVTMQMRELEPGLRVYECPRSGGLWIPLQSYLTWKEQQIESAVQPVGDSAAPLLQDDSTRRALICPESGRLLLRYKVGHGLKFHVDRSPVTGGVWLDKGEWEALRRDGLHLQLHLIFTAAYQRQARSSEYSHTLKETFRERIGPGEFSKVAEFGEWLASHPRRRDICCYLLDTLEQSA